MKAMILNYQQFVKKLEMGMWAFPKLPDLLDLSINITDLILFDVYSLVYLANFLTEQAMVIFCEISILILHTR